MYVYIDFRRATSRAVRKDRGTSAAPPSLHRRAVASSCIKQSVSPLGSPMLTQGQGAETGVSCAPLVSFRDEARQRPVYCRHRPMSTLRSYLAVAHEEPFHLGPSRRLLGV
ncbi:uncharacterized protein B0H18DRAFT_1127084 [Fomitopsis serialis]|uniref:uncharacterized protein n=1 Tax=Fomitopsis serialis TaxID=139415 RepID=UPI0020072161|nr:uncharacterized protein B0H18DRAFT_1127084 [Neoantrodia serialis]KAH9912510.1 hypothetical protein B0H18DRAFT_1127084 [Neoantrodia serialis]